MIMIKEAMILIKKKNKKDKKMNIIFLILKKINSKLKGKSISIILIKRFQD